MIYTASKVKHAHLWRELRASGVPINSTWIDEAGEGESASLSDLWTRCVQEAADATAVLLYVEPGDHLKGALVEVGAALASRRPVFIVGAAGGSWISHPLCRLCGSIEEAVKTIMEGYGS